MGARGETMSAGSLNVSDQLHRGIERGLEAYFATDTIAQLLDAVDFEALLTGEQLDEPIEYEKMGELIGQMVGRLAVRNSVGRFTPGQFVEQFVGYTVGGAVGKHAGKVLTQSQLERVARDVVRDVRRGSLDEFTADRPGRSTHRHGDVEPVRVEIESDDEAGTDGENAADNDEDDRRHEGADPDTD